MNDVPNLGYLWWPDELKSTDKFQAAQVEEVLREINENPRELSEVDFVVRGLRSILSPDKKAKKLPEEFTGKDVVTYQVTRESFEDGWLHFEGEVQITYDKIQGTLSCPVEIRALLEPAIEEQKEIYTSGDIRRVIKRIIDRTKQIKPRAGIYFVPEEDYHEIQKVIKLMGVIDLGYNEYPVPNIDSVKEQLRKTVEDDVKYNLRLMNESIDEMIEKGSDEKVFKRKLKDICDLRNKCEFYKHALDYQREQLNEAIEDASKRIEGYLAG